MSQNTLSAWSPRGWVWPSLCAIPVLMTLTALGGFEWRGSWTLVRPFGVTAWLGLGGLLGSWLLAIPLAMGLLALNEGWRKSGVRFLAVFPSLLPPIAWVSVYWIWASHFGWPMRSQTAVIAVFSLINSGFLAVLVEWHWRAQWRSHLEAALLMGASRRLIFRSLLISGSLAYMLTLSATVVLYLCLSWHLPSLLGVFEQLPVEGEIWLAMIRDGAPSWAATIFLSQMLFIFLFSLLATAATRKLKRSSKQFPWRSQEKTWQTHQSLANVVGVSWGLLALAPATLALLLAPLGAGWTGLGFSPFIWPSFNWPILNWPTLNWVMELAGAEAVTGFAQELLWVFNHPALWGSAVWLFGSQLLLLAFSLLLMADYRRGVSDQFINIYLFPSAVLLSVMAWRWGGTSALAEAAKGMLISTILLAPWLFRYLLLPNLQRLHNQMDQAEILGASRLFIFIQLTLPQCAQTLIWMLMLGALWVSGDHLVPTMVSHWSTTWHHLASEAAASYQMVNSLVYATIAFLQGALWCLMLFGLRHVFNKKNTAA